MSKVAYIFFGQVKNFDEKQYEAFEQNVGSKLKGHDVDYFLTTSKCGRYTSPRQENSEGNNVNINYRSIEKYFDFKRIFYDNESRDNKESIDSLTDQLIDFGEAWGENSKISTKNSLKQLYGLEYFWNNFKRIASEYDVFILSRCDLFHTHSFDINCLNEDVDLLTPYYDVFPKIDYGQFGGLNDRFAVAKNILALAIYCSRYSAIKKNPEYYHAEKYLKQHVERYKLNLGKLHNFLFCLHRANNQVSDFIGIENDQHMNTDLNKIDKSYVINLDRRLDRLHHIYKNTGFFTQRFSAADGKTIEVNDEIKTLFPKTWSSRSKSEICCALSHYRLWKKLIEDKNAQNYLVLEDDVVFEKGFVKFWNQVFSKHIPEDYNLIYLGGCQPWNKPQYHEVLKPHNDYFNNIKNNNFFSEDDHFWHMTTCSYIVSKNAASLMCQYIQQFGMERPLDFFMLRFFDQNKLFSAPTSVYHLNPLMTYQLHEEGGNIEVDEKSDIRNDKARFADNGITKIIHQSWKDKNIPYHIYKKHWVDSWKQKNPEWDYRLWTDEDNLNLVKNHYPQYLDLYNSYEKGVDKADIARFFYMHKYGGIYVDLDFRCLKPLDELFDGEIMVLGKQKMKQTGEEIDENVIPNAFKYSAPGEKFWLDCVDLLHEYKYDAHGNHTSPEVATGPVFLLRCLERLEPKNMKILEPEIFYPISWDTDGSAAKNSIREEWDTSAEKCFPEAYAVTYWTCAWRENSAVHAEKKKKMIILSDDLFEEDFIDELFGGVEYDKIFDPKMQTVQDGSIVVYSDIFSKNLNAYPEKHRNFLSDRQKQFQEYFDKCNNCILIHLSDEHCHAEIGHYENFKHVFRQYYRKDAVADNVTFIPLGYKKGFCGE
jgi:mannosyltransferase OCH1-like enzyme